MKELKPAILLLLVFSVVCGGIYPLLVTGIATVLCPGKVGGSFITDDHKRVIGSRLIGQPFTGAEYFWPRPSATGGFPYNPLASGGSNFGPANPAFINTVGERVRTLRDSGVTGSIPSDLVEASASGLDPHVSPEAAMIQIGRVARARGMAEEELTRIVEANIEDRQWGIWGQPRVNILLLNLTLDKRLR